MLRVSSDEDAYEDDDDHHDDNGEVYIYIHTCVYDPWNPY